MNVGWGTLLPFLGIPLLFGAATRIVKSDVEVQIDVLNLNRKLIGSYRGNAHLKIKSGLYKEIQYEPFIMSRVGYIMAITESIQKAKKNMEPDLSRLIKELN